jgi:hypothetical protein
MKWEQLVAEFMGLTPSSIEGRFWTRVTEEGIGEGELVHLHYKTSWDWLMPVVKKLYEIDIQEGDTKLESLYGDLACAVLDVDIEETYETCVKIIKLFK